MALAYGELTACLLQEAGPGLPWFLTRNGEGSHRAWTPWLQPALLRCVLPRLPRALWAFPHPHPAQGSAPSAQSLQPNLLFRSVWLRKHL